MSSLVGIDWCCLNISQTQTNCRDFIGEGAYSTVFRVKRTTDGAEYAMKKVKMVKLSEREK